MNCPQLLAATIVMVITPGVVAAQQSVRANDNVLDLSIIGDALEGIYTRNARPIGLPGQDLSFGILFTEDRDIVGNAGMMVPITAVQGLPVTFSFGGKAIAALLADPDADVFGLAPGVEARFNLGRQRPMAVVGSIFYSPTILTFGDADDILDIGARFEVGVTEATSAYAGYRLLNFDRDDGGEDDIADGLWVGVRFAF